MIIPKKELKKIIIVGVSGPLLGYFIGQVILWI